MNIVDNITQNWSKFELNMEISFLLSIFLISIVTIYFTTKEKKILLLSILALLTSAILNILGIFVINMVFDIEIREIFRIVPLLTSILLLSNLGILVGYYISKRDSKKFKISDIRKEYFTDTTKQTIFLLLLASSTLPFLSVQTESVVIVSSLSTIFSMWFSYWISKYILK